MSKDSQPVQASVIMSEYNTDPEKLDAAIKSILNQTFDNFELILVDDCGTNDLPSILKLLGDSRIRLLQNSRNMGLPSSLNRAISDAKSEILIRMDTDDIAHPDRVKKQVEFLKQNPGYTAVGSCANLLSDGIRVGTMGSPGEITARQLTKGRKLIHPTVAMRREAVLGVGGYPNYRRAEDFALWCELLLSGHKLFVMEDVLLDYRVDLEDYEKRTLSTRRGGIQALLYYYPKLGASPIAYTRVLKNVIAGALPASVMSKYHHNRARANSKRCGNAKGC